MSDHAKLSPSSAHRWMNCTGSVALCADVPRTSSDAARLGTAAHALIEWAIKKGLREVREEWVGEPFYFDYNGQADNIKMELEMVEHCNVFMRNLTGHYEKFHKLGIASKCFTEQRLSLEHIRPGMFGTADVIIEADRELIVSDFKYGYVPVHLVKDGRLNEQLMIYAAGAMRERMWMFDLVTLEIVQPRSKEVPDIQRVTIEQQELYDWVDFQLKPAADSADNLGQPLTPGDWCRFCPAVHKCPALEAKAQELALVDFQAFAPKDISAHLPESVTAKVKALRPGQIANILNWAPVMENFFKEVASHAYRLLERGEDVPGYKLVRGRGSREWPQSAEYHLKQRGLTDADLYEPRALRSPAQLEKLSKEAKAIVADIALKKPGHLTLASADSAREGVTGATEFAAYAVTDDL